MCMYSVSFYMLCVCLCCYSFDQEGHYLFTGAQDSHIYVLDAKPSKRFSVIGYTGSYSFQQIVIPCLDIKRC